MFDSVLRFLTQKQMLLSKNHEFYFMIARRPFESLHGFSKFELLNSKVSFLITSFALLTCSVVAEKKKKKKMHRLHNNNIYHNIIIIFITKIH